MQFKCNPGALSLAFRVGFIRFHSLGILLGLFLTMVPIAECQDVDSLLVQLSLRSPAAKKDLVDLGPSIFPKLLDYAVNKKDPLISQSAEYAISLLPESSIDVGYLSNGLLSGNDREFAVRSLEILGHSAKPAESEVLIFLTRPKTEYHDRLACVIGEMGIENTYHLSAHFGLDFNPIVLKALSCVRDSQSMGLLAQSIRTNSPLPANWAVQALNIITKNLVSGNVPSKDESAEMFRRRNSPRRSLGADVLEPLSDNAPSLSGTYSLELGPLLTDCLNQPLCTYREIAAYGLGLGPPAQAADYVPLLSKTVSDSNWSVRYASAISIIKITGKADSLVDPVLISGLSDQSIEKRRLSAKLLVEYSPKTPQLEKALRDPDKITRWTAAKAFVYGRNGEPAMNVFAEMIAEGEWQGPQGLAHIGDAALPLIEHLLDDARPKVRNGALESLFFMNKTDATKPLIARVLAMLNNSDVRKNATLALSSIADGSSVDSVNHLMSAVRDQSIDGLTREKAFQGLVRIGNDDPRIVPFLSQIVRSTHKGSYAQDLSELNGVNDEVLAAISIALANGAPNQIYYTWFPKIYQPLSEYWSRGFFSDDNLTRTTAQKLMISNEPEKAFDVIVAGIQRQETRESALTQLASLLNSDPYGEIPRRLKDRINLKAISWLLTSDTSLQAAAVEALIIAHGLRENNWSICRGEFSDQADVEPIKTMLSHREQVVQALLKVSGSSEDQKVRSRAAVLLEILAVDNSDLQSLLKSTTDDPDEFVHLFSVSSTIRSNLFKSDDILRLIAQHEGDVKASKYGIEYVDCVIESLKHTQGQLQPYVRRSLTAMLSSKKTRVRLAAANALLELRTNQAEATLALRGLAYLKEKEIRDSAIESLIKSKSSNVESLPYLLQKLKSSVYEQQQSAEMLKRIGEPAFLAVMSLAIREKRNEDEIFRESLATVLGEIAREDDLPTLYRLLETPKTRGVALEALSAMGPRAKVALPRLASLLKSHKAEVADRAALAIAKIEPANNVVLPYLCRSVISGGVDFNSEFDQLMHAKGLPGVLSIVSSVGHRLSLDDAKECIGTAYALDREPQNLEKFLSETSDQTAQIVLVGALRRHIYGFSDYMKIAAPIAASNSNPKARAAAISILIGLIDNYKQQQKNDESPIIPRDVVDYVSARLEAESDKQVKEQLLGIIGDCSEFPQNVYESVARIIKEDKLPELRVAATAALKSAGRFERIAGDALNWAVKNDPVRAVRLNAVESLERLGLPLMFHRDLGTLVSQEDDEVLRERLVQILRPTQETSLRFGEFLIKLCESDPSPTVRRSANQALVRIEPLGVNYLIEVSKTETNDRDSRINAIQAFRNLPLPRVKQVFESLLLDGDESIRLAAIDGLGSYGIAAYEEAAPLAKMLERGTYREQTHALRALSRIGRPSKNVISDVTEALKSDKSVVRGAACDALANIGTAAAGSAIPLVNSLNDADKNVRRSAAFALREINPDDPRAIAGLIRALNDPDLAVRQDAVGALGSYGARAKSALKSLRALKDDPRLAPLVECATMRIETDNEPQIYGSMEYRSSIPVLPDWPPAQPSDQVDSGDEYLHGANTLDQIYQRLTAILRPLGYSTTILQAPGGFALAARMEQFNPASGVSLEGPARWSDEPYDPGVWGRVRIATIGEDVDQRLFLFVITNQDIRAQQNAKLQRASLRNWVSAKGNYLPNSLYGVSSERARCLIMVYHFTGRERLFTLNRNSLSAETHLEKAGIKKRLDSYAIH